MGGVKAGGFGLSGGAQAGGAFAAHGHGDGRHAGGGGIGPFAIGKDVQERDLRFGDEGEGIAEQVFGFGREAGDQVGADGDAGPQAAGAGDDIERILAQMPALHALEDEVRAGLHGEVQMRHQAWLFGDQAPEVVVDLVRVERGEAEPG